VRTFALVLVTAVVAPVSALAATGDLTYVGCIANRGENGCREATHPSLLSSRVVAASRDGRSVYVASVDAVTWFKRRSSGALAYRGCIAAEEGAHGCKKARHNSLGGSLGIAVSPDDKSVYVTSLGTNSITRFNRHSNGSLTYKGCFANRGAHGIGGCKRPPHESLGDAFPVAYSTG
jgi:hypothetical protein